jgi:NAD(P)-dependent dehydrogenase (short-subunit alcohol dehydrogenase family)
MTGVMMISGASRGIGAATALAAAARGYAVCVNYLASPERAEAVVEEIRGRGGVALAVKADVSREAEVARLFETAAAELGPLTALVNNAGVLGGPAVRLEDVSEAQLDHTFAINIKGSFLCAREAVRRMSTARGGSGGAIVNLSSAAARLGSPGEFIHYAASKGAIDTMTTGLAVEVAREGIRVNAVRPGLIDTEIHDDSGIPDRVAKIARGVPAGRTGTAEEVTGAILWLLSEEASYVTGAIIDVSGGR